MNEIFEILADVFSFSNVFSFILGSGCMYTYIRIRDRRLDLKDPKHAPHVTRFKKVYLVLGIAALVVLFILTRTQVAANRADQALGQAKVVAERAEQIATENRQCQKEFNEAVKANALARGIDIDLSDREARAFAELFFALLAIDPNLPQEERQAQSRILSEKYAEVLRQTQSERIANEEYRKNNPYPEPTCGR